MMPDPPSKAGPLEAYLFHNYSALLSEAERQAYETIVEGRPCGRDVVTVSGLLAEGEIAFYTKAASRIMSQHGDEVVLNRCPRCESLCKTPQACQCQNPSCNHSWFETREE